MHPAAPLLLLALAALACSDGPTTSTDSTQPASADGGFSLAESPAPAPARSVAARAAKQEAAGDAAPTAAIAPTAAQPADAAVVAAPSMLIRTGNATVKVAALDAAVVRVRQMAARLGGYVANTTMEGGEDQVRSAMLELKLPASRFDEAVTGLDPVGDVESVSVHAQDVGEEFVDITARVANARRLEARLVELLAARTGRLEDVLAVERELARVREEIERHEGRIRYLTTRVAVSTLQVSLHEPYPVLGAADNPIVEAMRDAWRNFVGFIAWLIAATGVAVPVALLVHVAWRVVSHLRMRNRARRMAG